MNKEKKRRPDRGMGWDDGPRRPLAKERFIEKRQNWQDYLELSSDEEDDDRERVERAEDEEDSTIQ